ncbi:MAG: polysaccharide biosynthesis protein [Eubacteriaceae bacterium]|jgi:stage V sporulation protein B|nr:polysaccharide biosynthesis protein [Eubacteriaceae bacterium]
MSGKTFIRGAAILGFAGILVKVLGAIYQIPFTQMMGAAGLAYYTPAYYVYTVFIVLATSGIPVAISKMVSERAVTGDYEDADRVFSLSFKLMLAIGSLSFVLMYFGASLIADASNVPESALAMKTIAPALIIVPVMASFRGYYQGQQNMKPTALSQIAEQVLRVVFGLLAAYLLLHAVIGTDFLEQYSLLERGAAGGALGAVIGSLSGLVVMIIFYLKERKERAERIVHSINPDNESNAALLKKILIISIPITAGACISPVMTYLDAPIVINRLVFSGMAHAHAQIMYGEIGYCTPFINLPQALSMALSMSLVPLIASAHKMNDHDMLTDNTSLALRLSVIIGMPCAAGMAVLAEPILLLFYANKAAEAINAAPTFTILAVSILFVAIVQTVSGILQGIGKQMIPVRNMLIGIVIKIVTTWFLVSIRSLNIKGAAIGTLITYIAVACLDVHATRKYTGFSLNIKLTFLKPAAATGVMTVTAWLVYYVIFGGGQGNKIACIVSIASSGIVYLIMLFLTKSFTRQDLDSFGFGKKIIAFYDRIK